MGVATTELVVRITTDYAKAAAGMDTAATKSGKFSSAMRKAAVPAAAVGAAVLALGKKAVDAASDLEQAQGAVEAVFGKQAGAVEKYANSADTRMGLSASSYQQYAALVGKALQNAGMSVRESVGGTDKVMQRAADLSATYGGTTADAVDAINAAVSRSEFDPLEKYGVTLNMTAVNAELAAKGQDKLTGAALDSAKKAIILEQVYKKSAEAQGQFAKEGDTAAVAQQKAAASWDNAAASLGTAFLPVIAKAANMLAKFGGWAEKHTTLIQVFAGVVLALAAAIMVVNVALTIMSATPVVLIIAAIVAGVILLTAGLVLLYKRSETARTVMNAVWGVIKGGAVFAVAAFKAVAKAATKTWGWIKAHWPLLVGILFGPFGIAVALIIRNWSKVKKAITTGWNAIKSATMTVVRAIRSVFTGLWNAIKTGVRAAKSVVVSMWNAIRSAASNAVARVKSAFKAAWEAIKSGVRAAKDAVSTAFTAVRTAAERVVAKIRDIVSALGRIRVPDAFKTVWSGISTAIGKVVGAVQDLIRALGNIPTPHIDWPSPPGWFDKVMPGMAPAPPTGAPGLAARRGYTVAPAVPGVGAHGAPNVAARGGVNITVQGAIDPEATARQIQRILLGHNRRVGLVAHA